MKINKTISSVGIGMIDDVKGEVDESFLNAPLLQHPPFKLKAIVLFE